MNAGITSVIALSLLVSIAADVSAQPAARRELSPTGEKIKAAMESSIRTDAERARDRNRRPIQTLDFFGLTDDMRVLELVPGGGWYTKLLAPVLRENGVLFVAMGTAGVQRNLLNQSGFEHVKVVEVDVSSERVGGRRLLGEFSFDVEDIDLALTFRNLHNYTEEGRLAIAQAVFGSLKPGAHYGVVDHTRRHMQRDDVENGRRMDPVMMIKEIQSVGFELVDFSPLHYRRDDELIYEVGRRSVTGNTDRFTLLFRRP